MWKKMFSRGLNYSLLPFYRKFSNGQEAIFIHIPKTAGTSLKRAFGMPRPGMSLGKYIKHHTIPEMRDILPDEVWQRAFKFSIVRNPWERAVSHYLYQKREAIKKRGAVDYPPFNTWVQKKLNKPTLHNTIFRTQTSWLYNADNQLMVDYVGHFESLDKTYKHICSTLKIDVPPALKHINSGNYDGKTYHDFYDDEIKDLITQITAEDIKNFGYKF